MTGNQAEPQIKKGISKISTGKPISQSRIHPMVLLSGRCSFSMAVQIRAPGGVRACRVSGNRSAKRGRKTRHPGERRRAIHWGHPIVMNIRNIDESSEAFHLLERTDRTQTATITLGSGQVTSDDFNAHPHSDQTVLVLQGEVIAEVGGDARFYAPGKASLF
jgi:mannose-6-phosphate isomerase-like protein (cupin superfamily)